MNTSTTTGSKQQKSRVNSKPSSNRAASKPPNKRNTAGAAKRRNTAYDEWFDVTAQPSASSRSSSSSSTRSKSATSASAQASSKAPAAIKSAAAAKAVKKASTKKKRTIKPKRRKLGPLALLIRLTIAAVCLVLCWCLYAYYVVIFHEQQPLAKAEAGIVLGAALWNEQPSPALKERLDYAIELYEGGYVEYLILSGGKPENRRGLTEAEGMQQYLIKAGIPEDRLLLERQSRDTYQNLMYSQRVMDTYALNSVMIITHHYHTKRAKDIANYVGMPHVQTAGFQTEVLNESYHYTREMLAYTKWQLNKLFIPLGFMI